MEHDAEEVARVFGRAAPSRDTVIPVFATFGARLVDLAELRPGESVLDAGAGRRCDDARSVADRNMY